jgi:hypothetical protein
MVAPKMDDRPDATPFSGNHSGMIGKPIRESLDSLLGFPLGDGVSEENGAATDALPADADAEEGEAEQLCESGPLPIGRLPQWRAPTGSSPGTGALLTARCCTRRALASRRADADPDADADAHADRHAPFR